MKLEHKEASRDLLKSFQPVISQGPRGVVRTEAPTVRLIPVAEFRIPAARLLLSALFQMGIPPRGSVSLSVKWDNGPGKVDGMLLGGQP